MRTKQESSPSQLHTFFVSPSCTSLPLRKAKCTKKNISLWGVLQGQAMVPCSTFAAMSGLSSELYIQTPDTPLHVPLARRPGAISVVGLLLQSSGSGPLLCCASIRPQGQPGPRHRPSWSPGCRGGACPRRGWPRRCFCRSCRWGRACSAAPCHWRPPAAVAAPAVAVGEALECSGWQARDFAAADDGTALQKAGNCQEP